MNKSLTNRWYLKKQFCSIRMREGISITDHLDVYNKLLMDITNIGAKIKEEDKFVLLICSYTILL